MYPAGCSTLDNHGEEVVQQPCLTIDSYALDAAARRTLAAPPPVAVATGSWRMARNSPERRKGRGGAGRVPGVPGAGGAPCEGGMARALMTGQAGLLALAVSVVRVYRGASLGPFGARASGPGRAGPGGCGLGGAGAVRGGRLRRRMRASWSRCAGVSGGAASRILAM